MVDKDVEIDDVATVVGGGERAEAPGERGEAIVTQNFDCEGEFLRGLIVGDVSKGGNRGGWRWRSREKVVRENEEGEEREKEQWQVVSLRWCHGKPQE